MAIMERARWTLLACTIAAMPRMARAQEPAFGAAGQKVVFGDVGFELDFGTDQADELQTDWAVGVAPGILYFFARNLAVGLALRGTYADYAATAYPYTDAELAGSAGFGVNVPLSPRLSFFPKLWVGAGYMRRQYAEDALPDQTYYDPSFLPLPEPTTTIEGAFATAELGLPLQVQLGSAAYLGFGPSARLRLPFEDGTGLFRVGVTAGMGGFF